MHGWSLHVEETEVYEKFQKKSNPKKPVGATSLPAVPPPSQSEDFNNSKQGRTQTVPVSAQCPLKVQFKGRGRGTIVCFPNLQIEGF